MVRRVALAAPLIARSAFPSPTPGCEPLMPSTGAEEAAVISKNHYYIRNSTCGASESATCARRE